MLYVIRLLVITNISLTIKKLITVVKEKASIGKDATGGKFRNILPQELR